MFLLCNDYFLVIVIYASHFIVKSERWDPSPSAVASLLHDREAMSYNRRPYVPLNSLTFHAAENESLLSFMGQRPSVLKQIIGKSKLGGGTLNSGTETKLNKSDQPPRVNEQHATNGYSKEIHHFDIINQKDIKGNYQISNPVDHQLDLKQNDYEESIRGKNRESSLQKVLNTAERNNLHDNFDPFSNFRDEVVEETKTYNGRPLTQFVNNIDKSKLAELEKTRIDLNDNSEIIWIYTTPKHKIISSITPKHKIISSTTPKHLETKFSEIYEEITQSSPVNISAENYELPNENLDTETITTESNTELVTESTELITEPTEIVTESTIKNAGSLSLNQIFDLIRKNKLKINSNIAAQLSLLTPFTEDDRDETTVTNFIDIDPATLATDSSETYVQTRNPIIKNGLPYIDEMIQSAEVTTENTFSGESNIESLSVLPSATEIVLEMEGLSVTESSIMLNDHISSKTTTKSVQQTTINSNEIDSFENSGMQNDSSSLPEISFNKQSYTDNVNDVIKMVNNIVKEATTESYTSDILASLSDIFNSSSYIKNKVYNFNSMSNIITEEESIPNTTFPSTSELPTDIPMVTTYKPHLSTWFSLNISDILNLFPELTPDGSKTSIVSTENTRDSVPAELNQVSEVNKNQILDQLNKLNPEESIDKSLIDETVQNETTKIETINISDLQNKDTVEIKDPNPWLQLNIWNYNDDGFKFNSSQVIVQGGQDVIHYNNTLTTNNKKTGNTFIKTSETGQNSEISADSSALITNYKPNTIQNIIDKNESQPEFHSTIIPLKNKNNIEKESYNTNKFDSSNILNYIDKQATVSSVNAKLPLNLYEFVMNHNQGLIDVTEKPVQEPENSPIPYDKVVAPTFDETVVTNVKDYPVIDGPISTIIDDNFENINIDLHVNRFVPYHKKTFIFKKTTTTTSIPNVIEEIASPINQTIFLQLTNALFNNSSSKPNHITDTSTISNEKENDNLYIENSLLIDNLTPSSIINVPTLLQFHKNPNNSYPTRPTGSIMNQLSHMVMQTTDTSSLSSLKTENYQNGYPLKTENYLNGYPLKTEEHKNGYPLTTEEHQNSYPLKTEDYKDIQPLKTEEHQNSYPLKNNDFEKNKVSTANLLTIANIKNIMKKNSTLPNKKNSTSDTKNPAWNIDSATLVNEYIKRVSAISALFKNSDVNNPKVASIIENLALQSLLSYLLGEDRNKTGNKGQKNETSDNYNKQNFTGQSEQNISAFSKLIIESALNENEDIHLFPVEIQSKPVVTDSKPLVTQSTPVVTQTTSVVTQTTPVTQSKPVMTRFKPVKKQSKPVVTQSTPVVTQSRPAAIQIKPVVTRYKPVRTQSKPIVEHSHYKPPVKTKIKPFIMPHKSTAKPYTRQPPRVVSTTQKLSGFRPNFNKNSIIKIVSTEEPFYYWPTYSTEKTTATSTTTYPTTSELSLIDLTINKYEAEFLMNSTVITTTITKDQTFTESLKHKVSDITKMIGSLVPSGSTFQGCLSRTSCAFALASSLAIGATGAIAFPFMIPLGKRRKRQLMTEESRIFGHPVVDEDHLHFNDDLMREFKRILVFLEQTESKAKDRRLHVMKGNIIKYLHQEFDRILVVKGNRQKYFESIYKDKISYK